MDEEKELILEEAERLIREASHIFSEEEFKELDLGWD